MENKQTIAQQLGLTIERGDTFKIYHPKFKDKIIYYEGFDYYFEKTEYDSNGNEINFEDSDGFWYKCQYDSNGNKIYYESKNGVIYDFRPKVLELTLEEIAEKFNISVELLKIKK